MSDDGNLRWKDTDSSILFDGEMLSVLLGVWAIPTGVVIIQYHSKQLIYQEAYWCKTLNGLNEHQSIKEYYEKYNQIINNCVHVDPCWRRLPEIGQACI